MIGSTKITKIGLAGLATAVLLVACSKSEEQPAPQTAAYQQPGQQPGTYGTATAPAPTATAAPTAAPTATTAAAAGPCQADPTAATAASPLITALAASEVPAGAKPVGTAVACNFQQGQTLESAIQLNPGKCYTIVAAGVPTVTQLDLQLVAQTIIPGMAPVLAQSTPTGSQAVIGKKPDCYKWALGWGAPAKVILKATAGSGYAAAQVYEK